MICSFKLTEDSADLLVVEGRENGLLVGRIDVSSSSSCSIVVLISFAAGEVLKSCLLVDGDVEVLVTSLLFKESNGFCCNVKGVGLLRLLFILGKLKFGVFVPLSNESSVIGLTLFKTLETIFLREMTVVGFSVTSLS